MRPYTRTALFVFMAVAALLVLVSACGGGDSNGDGGDGSGADEQQITAIGVTLTVPSPWVGQESFPGLVAGPSEEALESSVGPRLLVGRGSRIRQAVSEYVPGLGSAPPIQVVAGPDTVSFGSEEGVFVQYLEEHDAVDVMKWFAVLNVDGISVYQFIVEAPESEWDAESPGLIAIATSAIFEASTAASAGQDDASEGD